MYDSVNGCLSLYRPAMNWLALSMLLMIPCLRWRSVSISGFVVWVSCLQVRESWSSSSRGRSMQSLRCWGHRKSSAEKRRSRFTSRSTFIFGQELWVIPVTTLKFKEWIQVAERLSLDGLSGPSGTGCGAQLPEKIMEKSRCSSQFMLHPFKNASGCLPGEMLWTCPNGRRTRGTPKYGCVSMTVFFFFKVKTTGAGVSTGSRKAY